jgi:hypothetical protein
MPTQQAALSLQGVLQHKNKTRAKFVFRTNYEEAKANSQTMSCIMISTGAPSPMINHRTFAIARPPPPSSEAPTQKNFPPA